MIPTKFQRLRPCFLGQTTGIDYWEYTVLCLGMSSNKDGGHYPEIIIVSITDAQLNSVNIAIAVEILLLTYIRAELQVIYHVLSVKVRHLRFPTSPDPGNMGVAV